MIRDGFLKITDEPLGRQAGNFLKSAGLLKKMGGAGHDVETVSASEQLLGVAIEFDDAIIQSADDQ